MVEQVDTDQVLAFRLHRSGLAARDARDLAEAAACPASDFAAGAALLALAARAEDVSRDGYREAVDNGDLVLAHIVRSAIHALAPADLALYGRALIARDERELAAQVGAQTRKLAGEHGFSLTEAVDEVTAAVTDALTGGRKLDKDELHEEMRRRVRAELLPWCRSCGSHHVPPTLWRHATVKAGTRLDSERRYALVRLGSVPAAGGAVRRFLGFYGPATPGDFAAWAGITPRHAKRVWSEVTADLVEAQSGWLLREDVAALESPPAANGIRLLPPGDPYLQTPNRPLLAPDAELRKRMFRPVASPGAVLKDGRLTGLWRIKAKGRTAEITVEPLGRLARADLDEEARRVAELRGADRIAIAVT
jgi:hypothetical protein